MRRFLNLVLVSTILSAGFGVLPAFAQTNTGRIVGTVSDESGALMPGVEVTVRNPSTNLSRNVITNESGTYTVPLLPPALYEVQASLPGFRPEVRTGVTVQVDAVVRLDFALKVGSVSDKIEVMADAPLVQSETATLGQVMDSRKVTDIPLNLRHFMQLTVLTTGVMPTVQGSNLSSQNLSFEANGGRERDNNFLLDGVDNNDTGNSQLNIVPSVDAIEEFKISTSNYGAELGRAGGGVINVQTKAGANDFRMVFFEFLRNDKFDARNFFATTKQPYKRNQFGTVISGPIKKDRAFFMFNYEGYRIRNTNNSLQTVPSLKQSLGDFSELTRAIIDPATGQAFPGNIIPAARMNRLGSALASYFPLPNRVATGNNYLATTRGLWNFYIVTGRVDYRVSEKQNVFGRFTYQDSYQVDPGTSLPHYGTVYFQPIGRNAALSDTYVFGPRVVNEFRIGFNRLIGGLFGEFWQQDIAKQLGVTGVQSQVNPHVGQYFDYGLPSVSVSGLSGIGGTSAQIRIDNTWHWYDMLAVTRGNHQIKMGGEFRTTMLNVIAGGTPNGSFTFNGVYSGNAFADLLLGYPSQTARGLGDNHAHTRDRQLATFFQDDWKITPTLTLNLGVRWEFMTPFVEAHSDQAAFDPATQQVVIAGKSGLQTFANPITGAPIVLAGGADLGYAKGLYQLDLNNFAPRFGFAWSPKALNMVFRGGFGIFTTPEIANPMYQYRNAAYPWNINQTFIADTTRPNISLTDPFPSALAQNAIATRAVDKNWRNGYMEQFNFGMQQPLGANMVLDVSYAGSKGAKLITSRDINQPVLGPGAVNSRRPFQGWTAITQAERSQWSNYHSLQAKFERRFSAGLTFVTAYTWSHAIDNGDPGGTSSGGTQNNYNLAAEKGNATYDIRHRLVNSYSYQLPFGPDRHFLSGISGALGALIGGWQVAGVSTFSTGQAFTPAVTGDIAQIGGNSVRPNRIGDGVLPRGQRTASRWFDTSAFTIPATGTFGNSARAVLRAPGINNWDFTLMKKFQMGETHRVEFRWELFNALNHPNFLIPNATVNSAAFGTVTQAKDARQMQFGLKLYY